MYYVKPITVGPAGHGPIDPDRRDTLPAGTWRPVPENPYWLRLAAMRDVELRRADNPPRSEEIEGYEPPPAAVPAAAEMADKAEEVAPAVRKSSSSKGSDA